MTEKEYHALRVDRYSSIKLFLEDRKKYYSKYILREDNREIKTQATLFGSLCDCLLFTPDQIDERFVLCVSVKPTGQMGELLDVLWDKTISCLSEDGIVTRSIDSLVNDAFNSYAFDKNGKKIAFKRPNKTANDIIEELANGPAGDWYREKRQSSDKDLITQQDLDNANKVVEGLKTNFATSEIINASTDDNITVLDQLIILFEYNEVNLKSMLDKVIIDHDKKTIKPYDLKTTYNVEGFDYNYRTLKYYIQAATYDAALCNWATQEGLEDYIIEPISFIVTDSTLYMNPLIYDLDETDISDGYNGYWYNGTFYPGLNQALDDLKWHKETNIWNISAENFRNGGRRKIKRLGTISDEYQTDNNEQD